MSHKKHQNDVHVLLRACTDNAQYTLNGTQLSVFLTDAVRVQTAELDVVLPKNTHLHFYARNKPVSPTMSTVVYRIGVPHVKGSFRSIKALRVRAPPPGLLGSRNGP